MSGWISTNSKMTLIKLRMWGEEAGTVATPHQSIGWNDSITMTTIVNNIISTLVITVIC